MKLRQVLAWSAIVLFVVTLPTLAVGEQVRYDDWKIVRAVPESQEQIDQIHELGIRLFSDYEGVGPVDYLVPPEALEGLEALGVQYDVRNDNVQKTIDAERAWIEAEGRVDPRDPSWYLAYKDFDQIVAKLNTLVADYPDLCTLMDIGDTLQGRDIWCLRISGPGADKPAVLFNGTQHAREWISPMTVMWIAENLCDQYATDPQIQALVNGVEFFIVPVVNADGYEYSWDYDRMWRKTRRNVGSGCYGVDPNRNWAEGWGGNGSSGYPCDETYRGPSPFSEPCTAALRDFFIANPQIVSNIDYHSYSQLILSPYGYTPDYPPDHDTFMFLNEQMHDEILAVHGETYAYGPIYHSIYPASGGSVDWCYGDQGVFSFTIELRPESAWEGGFELPPEQIIPTCEENWPAALFLSQWSMSDLMLDFPNGLPARLIPDTPEAVLLEVLEVGAELDPASPRVYARVGESGTFAEYPLTSIGNNQFAGDLPGTPCGRTLQYYFAVDTMDGAVVTEPADAPATLFDVTAAPIVLMVDEDMSANPGWTTQSQWAWGQPTGGGGQYGNPDPTSGFTGSNVYGYNLYGDYANNMPEYHLTSTPMDCTGVTGVTLSFYRYLNVEQPAYDHAYVRVSNNGTSWTTVWQNDSTITDSAWSLQELDISAVADDQPTVYLRWTMGTTDVGWRYSGWNIDDVQVWAADPNGCPNMLGDLNCDGAVDFDDINAFVLALSGQAGYEAAYPDCDWYLADCDEDGDVDFDDINPFVSLIGS